MEAHDSKNFLLYRQVRRDLQSGRYAPGQRIDPATLAAEFHTSPTPVRFALYRLVGEGLLIDHARSGMYVPRPSEVALRDLYDWMERLLLIACDMGLEARIGNGAGTSASNPDVDVVKLTWQLFDSIARAADHRSLHLAVKRANDQLAPIRRAKQMLGVFGDTSGELEALQRAWKNRDIESLRTGIVGYHVRRKRLVPRIVALLVERREYPD